MGKAIGAGGGAPTPTEAAELQHLNGEMHRIERLEVILLTISLVTMATARYWIF
jgi:hypothetical protein